jgi:uncharacterized protein with von Willebrand factor type A (vWA) domain
MEGNEQYVIRAFNEFVLRFENEENVNIGIILFSEVPVELSPLQPANNQNLKDDINALSGLGGDGMTHAASSLREATMKLLNGPGEHKVIIFISDGQLHDTKDTINESETSKLKDINICSIYIRNNDAYVQPIYGPLVTITPRHNTNLAVMLKISSGPDWVTDTDFAGLEKTLKDLSLGCM